MHYSKYNAKKTTVNGIEFASKKEAVRYLLLKGMENEGLIHNLNIQVPYELIPNQKLETPRLSKKGKAQKTERKVEYIADFVYEQGGKLIVEDTKGMKTPEYIIKRKLMKYLKGIEIKEV